MTNDQTDWVRLQKALAVEAERGFTDLMGRQYRFSEFLCLSFGQPPANVMSHERRRWQQMAAQFGNYPTLSMEERQHLVAEARRYLYQMQQSTTPVSPPSERSTQAGEESESLNSKLNTQNS